MQSACTDPRNPPIDFRVQKSALQNQTNRNQRVAAPLLLSIALYVAACAFPALILHNGQRARPHTWVWLGYQSESGLSLLGIGLVWGWIRLNFTAFANLPLWFSWLLFSRKHFAAAKIACTLALVLSLETFQLLFQPMWYDKGAVVQGYLAAPHIGFFCWIGSMPWSGTSAVSLYRRRPRGLRR